MLINTFSLSFMCLFHIKWDNFRWQSDKCITPVPACYCSLTHAPPKHHIHLRTTNPLQNYRFKPLEKAPPYPYAAHSHFLFFLSAGPDTLKGAGESDHYTTTESGSLIPVSAQQRRCQNIHIGNTDLHKPSWQSYNHIRASLSSCSYFTTRNAVAVAVAVPLLSEWMEQVFHLAPRAVRCVTSRTVPMSTGVREGLWNAVGQGHAGGTSHVFPLSSVPNSVTWRRGLSLTACVTTASLQRGTSQEPSKGLVAGIQVCVSWTYCQVLLQIEVSHPQQLSELPILLLSFLHLWTFQNMQSFHQDTHRLFSLQSSPHLHSLLPQGFLHPESTSKKEKAKHLVVLYYPWCLSFLAFCIFHAFVAL